MHGKHRFGAITELEWSPPRRGDGACACIGVDCRRRRSGRPGRTGVCSSCIDATVRAAESRKTRPAVVFVDCLVALLRAVLPACVVAYLATVTLGRDWAALTSAVRLTSRGITSLVLGRAFELGWKAALVLLAWAIADFFFERKHLAGELRMTRQELKDDYKETEGNPLIKGRIRRLRRITLRRRMLDDVTRASVVIHNHNE